jgi:hypothetical protein
VTEHTGNQRALAKPKFKEATAKLAAKPGAAYPDTLLLKDRAHCSAHRSTLVRREFRDKPLTHRLDAALILIELEPEGWWVHLTRQG